MTSHTTEDLNLSPHRASTSVWDRRGWNGTADTPPSTRVLVGVGGGALAIQGFRRGGVTGSMIAGLGCGLAWWALTGRSSVPELRRWIAETRERRGLRADVVYEASADSFPASDPPSFTPAVGTGLRRRGAAV
jgi:hypothetical protein